MREDGGDLDWSTWRHLPVVRRGAGDAVGYVRPRDRRGDLRLSVANARIAGRNSRDGTMPPNYFFLVGQAGTVGKYAVSGGRLTKRCERRFLVCRSYDENGRRLLYATPAEVENNAELGRRWAEIEQRAEARRQAISSGRGR